MFRIIFHLHEATLLNETRTVPSEVIPMYPHPIRRVIVQHHWRGNSPNTIVERRDTHHCCQVNLPLFVICSLIKVYLWCLDVGLRKVYCDFKNRRRLAVLRNVLYACSPITQRRLNRFGKCSLCLKGCRYTYKLQGQDLKILQDPILKETF